MFAISLLDFLSLLWGSSTNIYFLFFLSNISFEGQKIRFKTWMGLVGQILIKLGTSHIWFFFGCLFDVLLGVTHAIMLVATQAPLKHAPHLTCQGLCSMEVWKLNGAICAMVKLIYTQYLRNLENTRYFKPQSHMLLHNPSELVWLDDNSYMTSLVHGLECGLGITRLSNSNSNSNSNAFIVSCTRSTLRNTYNKGITTNTLRATYYIHNKHNDMQHTIIQKPVVVT